MIARVTDLDPVTIVQARLGLLAPPGQSDTWIAMRDDGIGADAEAGDGIWSVSVEVRPGVPGGTTTFDIRGIDQQLAQTPVNDRTFSIELGTSGEGGGGGQAVLEGASNVWIILGVIGLLLALVAAGIFVWIRKGGLKEMMTSSGDPWK
jgi:hypothetical protein